MGERERNNMKLMKEGKGATKKKVGQKKRGEITKSTANIMLMVHVSFLLSFLLSLLFLSFFLPRFTNNKSKFAIELNSKTKPPHPIQSNHEKRDIRNHSSPFIAERFFCQPNVTNLIIFVTQLFLCFVIQFKSAKLN